MALLCSRILGDCAVIDSTQHLSPLQTTLYHRPVESFGLVGGAALSPCLQGTLVMVRGSHGSILLFRICCIQNLQQRKKVCASLLVVGGI